MCSASLDSPIRRISTSKVHLRQLALYLIDLATQILDVARKCRNLIELSPLVGIGDHLRDKELLFFQHDELVLLALLLLGREPPLETSLYLIEANAPCGLPLGARGIGFPFGVACFMTFGMLFKGSM